MFKLGDAVRVSERLLTIDYSRTYIDSPTRAMIDLIGKSGIITKVSSNGKEFEISLLPGIFWMSEELDLSAVNKGNFTNVKEV